MIKGGGGHTVIKVEQEAAHVLVIDLPSSVRLFLRDDLATKTKSSHTYNDYHVFYITHFCNMHEVHTSKVIITTLCTLTD